ncbi:VanZ family protein [Candidatus Chloroploca sp. M-50]|uniref:VanZ family protein n=1 Tax=Candidatus Chloroploca mongolica TaxID=2528176 RepID=A0ABS4DG31_9CHLR|nr:VanZ family protein [Candidatus Chloroploca mongolica]MBP1468400.1 VanZ family protein [Candidatus Chloroploca mongolica]
MLPLHSTSARLAAAMLGYFILVIVLLTLYPFYFAIPTQFEVDLRVRLDDIIENIILLLPIGFLYRLTGGSRRGALILGFTLSISIESLQLFLPVRTAAPVDVGANTLGALAGAWLYDHLTARIAMTPAMVGRLALEIPLMGLLYLLIPLLWMNSLALESDPDRWMLTVLICMSGAIILSDIYRMWGGQIGLRSKGWVGLAAAGWCLLGMSPGFLRVLPTLPMVIGVALLTAGLAARPWHMVERRFERITLKRILPGLILYVILLALWPPFRELTAWHGTFGLTDRIEPVNTRYPAALLEYLAAFTVLGYISAEWRGRAELPFVQDLPRLLLVALGAALVLELLVGFQKGHGASFVRLLFVVTGALSGGLIYNLQRSHVRFLLGHPERLNR